MTRRTIQRFTCAALIVLTAACHRGGKAPVSVTPEKAAAAPINSVSRLVQAMRNKYAENWYHSLSFTQVNRYTLGGKEQKSEWLENLSVPGKLRIDFLPSSQKSGVLVNNSRVLTFSGGKRVDTRRMYQARPFLTSDIYVLSQAVAMRRLDSLGVDTTRFRTDRLNGERVFVIGAASGDLTSTQAWFDAESLLLLRFVQSETRSGKTTTSDLRVTGYTTSGGFPIPEAFVTTRTGGTTLREQYTDVRVNPVLPASLFDPDRW